jgi:hypothetical protein
MDQVRVDSCHDLSTRMLYNYADHTNDHRGNNAGKS